MGRRMEQGEEEGTKVGRKNKGEEEGTMGKRMEQRGRGRN